MDSLIRTVQELKEIAGYKGSPSQFRTSTELVTLCRKKGLIADVRDPADICKSAAGDYYTHLVALTKQYLFEHKEMKVWGKFAANPGNRKAQKILHEFGVRGELFSDNPEDEYDPVAPSASKITLMK